MNLFLIAGFCCWGVTLAMYFSYLRGGSAADADLVISAFSYLLGGIIFAALMTEDFFQTLGFKNKGTDRGT